MYIEKNFPRSNKVGGGVLRHSLVLIFKGVAKWYGAMLRLPFVRLEPLSVHVKDRYGNGLGVMA